ncbi:MAG TPA: hypothetical protein VMH86_13920 [Rhizomicrobium sp.]|nr:hypothetical protein [Rhizomicrobium sp.]
MSLAGALLRGRIAVLSALAIIGTAAAGLCANVGVSFTAGGIGVMAAVFAVMAAGLPVTLRSASLTVVALLCPLPGLAVAAFIGDWQWPEMFGAQDLAAGWLAGLALSAWLAWAIAVRIASGGAPREAAAASMRELTVPLLAALLFALALQAFDIAAAPLRATLLAAAGSGLSAIVATPLLASLARPGESFVTHFNRALERRNRRLAFLDFATQSRWAWSLGGIALVLAALGFFGLQIRPVQIGAGQLWLLLPCALAVLAIAGLGDWRFGLAAVLAMAPAALLALRMAPAPAAAFPALGPGAIAAFLIASAAATAVRRGDDVPTALIRALAGSGAAAAGILATAAAAWLACVPFAPRADAVSLAEAVLAIPAALAFVPAFGVVIERVTPRRATVEARYRVR